MNARGGSGNTGSQPFEFRLSTSNVGALAVEWQGTTWAGDLPVVADLTHVFTAGSVIHAYRSDGGSDCLTGTCVADWNYSTGAWFQRPPAPALSGSTLFAITGTSNFESKLLAFPERPDATCSGTPLFCPQIWSANLPFISETAPIVANGRVYVETSTGMSVFDAAGETGCSGAPKVCTPLWTALARTSPYVGVSVANGHVFLPIEGNRILAYDDAGVDGCAGSPVVCTPTFEMVDGEPPAPSGRFGLVAVAGDRAYSVDVDGVLRAFDARGIEGCSGTPTICLPLWSTAAGVSVHGAVAVGEGRVFVSRNREQNSDVAAFDAGGVVGCSGTPTVCNPEWVAPGIVSVGGPSVANGVVYVASTDYHLYTLDAAGCPAPANACAPLASLLMPYSMSLPAVIVGGRVFVAGDDGNPTLLSAISTN